MNTMCRRTSIQTMTSSPSQPERPPITPWNPSRRATARVANPLPVPETCRHCGGRCSIVNNEVIYGQAYGEWPWAVLCEGCGAYAGLHPFTGIPQATLATREIREWRKRAKVAFNPLWQAKGARMTRTEAYHWLALQLRIEDVGTCHIGWFDVPQCAEVVLVCNKEVPSEQRNPNPRKTRPQERGARAQRR